MLKGKYWRLPSQFTVRCALFCVLQCLSVCICLSAVDFFLPRNIHLFSPLGLLQGGGCYKYRMHRGTYRRQPSRSWSRERDRDRRDEMDRGRREEDRHRDYHDACVPATV